jgi:hypothetical protein
LSTPTQHTDLLIMGVSAGSSAVALAFLESIADSALFPLLLQLLLVFLFLFLVLTHMVNPYDPPKDFSPIQIVYTRDNYPIEKNSTSK